MGRTKPRPQRIPDFIQKHLDSGAPLGTEHMTPEDCGATSWESFEGLIKMGREDVLSEQRSAGARAANAKRPKKTDDTYARTLENFKDLHRRRPELSLKAVARLVVSKDVDSTKVAKAAEALLRHRRRRAR
jgi:hypothetical protein